MARSRGDSWVRFDEVLFGFFALFQLWTGGGCVGFVSQGLLIWNKQIHEVEKAFRLFERVWVPQSTKDLCTMLRKLCANEGQNPGTLVNPPC